MKIFVVFLPLIGFVAAQMQGNLVPNHQDPFYKDLGLGTSSKTPPPWALPPQHQAAQGQGGGIAGQSQSSTKPPYYGMPAAPVGGPQLQNNNPYANADPNAQGGNSGGLAGFGETDVFHSVLGAQPGAAQAAGGAAGAGGGQRSGEQGGGFIGGGGNGIDNALPIGAGDIGGGGFNANDLKEKSDAGEVYGAASSVTTVVGVVVAVLIVIGIFALVAVFLVRQRRQSRVVIGSV